MVPGGAWPGSDQCPWGTAPAAGPAGRLGRPNVPTPWGVVCCTLYFGLPGRARVCGVHGPLAFVHRAGAWVWVCCLELPGPRFLWWCVVARAVSVAFGFGSFRSRFVPFLVCLFVFLCTVFCLVCVFCKNKKRKREKENNRRRHGLRAAVQCASLWFAVFFFAAHCWLLAATPQGCKARVVLHMGAIRVSARAAPLSLG